MKRERHWEKNIKIIEGDNKDKVMKEVNEFIQDKKVQPREFKFSTTTLPSKKIHYSIMIYYFDLS